MALFVFPAASAGERIVASDLVRRGSFGGRKGILRGLVHDRHIRRLVGNLLTGLTRLGRGSLTARALIVRAIFQSVSGLDLGRRFFVKEGLGGLKARCDFRLRAIPQSDLLGR